MPSAPPTESRPAIDSAISAQAPIVDRLRVIARDLLRRERRDHTLQATALANECYLLLRTTPNIDIDDSEALERLAWRIQRNLLVNHGVAKRAQKRGGHRRRVPLSEALSVEECPEHEQRLDLRQALDWLRVEYPLSWRAIHESFFLGRSTAEIAREADRSVRTIQCAAKAGLMRLSEFLAT